MPQMHTDGTRIISRRTTSRLFSLDRGFEIPDPEEIPENRWTLTALTCSAMFLFKRPDGVNETLPSRGRFLNLAIWPD